MISPLMTCSARLPVYTLLISTFVPAVSYGPFSAQGLVMFGMYLLAVVVALAVAFVLHKLDFQNRKHLVDFIHLPHYRQPNWRELIRFVWTRVFSFLKKAGTIIAAMAILLWALLTFPQNYGEHPELNAKIEAVQTNSSLSDEDKASQVEAIEAAHSAHDLENSYGGRLGHLLEPVFQPIGYDWKLTIGILASLAAREVFVATIGTVFSLGNVDEHSEGLTKVLKESKKPDGTPAYTLATCLSLLVFFAFSLQCVSTIGVARRETNSWKIPGLMFGYMFFLAYGTAFLAFHVTNAFLG
jgi:ferrous iron transport protein B